MRAIPAAALVLVTIACYLPAFRGGFIWDDDRHVSDNRMLHNFHGLWRIWAEPGVTPQYYPMTHTSFWIERRIWQDNPTGFHIVNVLLHSLNAILFWRLLLRLELPGAWLAAAVFAWHPINVESVAWISERKNVLATCFMLLSIHAYLRPGLVAFFASFALFTCALLSKTITCSMPAVVLLILWWKNRATFLEVAKLIPFFALGLVMGLITAGMETSHVGASGPDWDLRFSTRSVIAGAAIWFYLWKLLWPARLTFSYPRWDFDPVLWWQWVFPIGVAIALLILWLNRERFGKGPIVAALIFVGTLFPALGFFNTYPMRYSFVADHFVYISSMALIAPVIAMATRLRISRAAVIALLPLLVILTWRQARIYASAEAIWRDTLTKNPASWMAGNNLAMLLAARGEEEMHAGQRDSGLTKLKESLTLLDRVQELRPAHEKLAANRADVLLNMGRLQEALTVYEAMPRTAGTVNQIGVALGRMGRSEEGMARFREAVSLDPQQPAAFVNLARALEAKGDFDNAIDSYRRALQVRPGDPVVRLSLANLLYRPEVNRLVDAAAEYEAYLNLAPDDANAHAALGFVYGELSRYDEAKRQFQAALKLEPGNAQARQGMQRLLGPLPATRP
jgi:tetratricopeptide (TPR) repeat protein